MRLLNLVPALLLMACSQPDKVDRPTNEESERLDEIEAMLDEE